MAVQLLLVEDVANLGKIGDQVHVSDGYARNYLLPRKLAVAINAGTKKMIQARQLKLQKEHEERVAVAKTMAEKIEKLQITIKVKTGENDKLFGSVAAQQIVEAVAAEGVELDKNALVMAEALRELGSFDIPVKLHAEVTCNLKVQIVRADA